MARAEEKSNKVGKREQSGEASAEIKYMVARQSTTGARATRARGKQLKSKVDRLGRMGKVENGGREVYRKSKMEN